MRWNHIVEPKYTKPGREVDKAFISFAELSQVTGLDVEADVKRQLAEILEKIKKIPKGKKVYEGPEGICFARNRLYWYNEDFNPIDPPEKIKGSINLVFDGNNRITSLKGSPRVVGGDFDCSQTSIISLEGGPEEVEGNFWCSYTKIISLKGCPREIRRNFWCSYTNITSLEGSPEKIGGGFCCSKTKITSLEGSPKKVGGYFDCPYTKITSLKGAPAEIGDIKYSRFSDSISA